MAFVLYPPNELAQRLAARVRELRLEHQLSQQQLADRTGIELPTYRLFERSGRISLVRLASIATALGRAGEFDALFAAEAPRSIDEVLARQKKRKRASVRRTKRSSGTDVGATKK